MGNNILHSSVYIAMLILVSQNYFIECGSKRQTVCLKELDAFSVRKTTENASSDTRPNICSTVFGCCNKTIEDEMKIHSTKELMNLTHERNEKVRQDLKDIYSGLEGIHQDVLQLIAGSAIESLQSHYKNKMTQDATPHIHWLFRNLQTAVTKKDLHLQNSTTTFFQKFYPIVHQHIVVRKKLPDDFAKCLKDNMHVILPFEDVPAKVTALLTKKLRAVQVFLRSLQIIGHVLDAIDNVELSQECASSLVKMSYCSLCDGFSDAKPCMVYCTDVISSCLEPYTAVEEKWSSFVTELIQFRSNLAKSLDASTLFARLQEFISESVSHTGHSRVQAAVAKHCGNITDYKGNDIVSRRPSKQTGTREVGNGDLYIVDDHSPKFQNLPTSSDISERLMFLKNNLSSIKHHLKVFHINICLNDGLSASDNDDCWIGDGLGRYKGAIQSDAVLSPDNSDTIKDDVLLLLKEASDDIQKVKFPSQEEDDGSGGSTSDDGSASGSGYGSGVDPTDTSDTSDNNGGSGKGCSDDDDDEDNCSSGDGDRGVHADQPYDNKDHGKTTESVKVARGSGASYHTQTSLTGFLLLSLAFSR